MVIGTVKGDLHDIGKNLVASMLEGAGFEVVDLGADVPPEKFVAAVKERGATLVCLSGVADRHDAGYARDDRGSEERRHKGSCQGHGRRRSRDAQFATEIGADGYSENASAAVAIARSLVAVHA